MISCQEGRITCTFCYLVNSRAKLVIVMGVSGCGKSTVAKALSESFDYQFLEADDFHPELNKQWMSTGKPLTNAMRAPWIEALREHLSSFANDKINCVMSFSGLLRSHRAKMRELPLDVSFLHLVGEAKLIRERMSQRENHFMPESLLASQFATMEDTMGEKDISRINIAQDVKAIVAEAQRKLQ